MITTLFRPDQVNRNDRTVCVRLLVTNFIKWNKIDLNAKLCKSMFGYGVCLIPLNYWLHRFLLRNDTFYLICLHSLVDVANKKWTELPSITMETHLVYSIFWVFLNLIYDTLHLGYHLGRVEYNFANLNVSLNWKLDYLTRKTRSVVS